MKKKLAKKKTRKSVRPYKSKWREKIGMSVAEIAELMGWSYTSVHNVLTKPGYENDYKFMVLKIQCYLAKKGK